MPLTVSSAMTVSVHAMYSFRIQIIRVMMNAANTSGCKILNKFVQKIANHFRQCCTNCQGNEQLLKEMFVSAKYHLTGPFLTCHFCLLECFVLWDILSSSTLDPRDD